MRMNLYSSTSAVRVRIRVRVIAESSGVVCHVVFEASEVFFYVTRNTFATSSSINRGERQQHFSCDFFLLQKNMRQQNFFLGVGTFAGINKNHENSHLYLTQS